MYTLLNPGVDPRPHQYPRPDLSRAGRPAPLRRHRRSPSTAVSRPHPGRHNAAFDYAFLAAEAHRCDTELPVTSVLCTLELAACSASASSASPPWPATGTSPRPVRAMHSTTPESWRLSFDVPWSGPPNSRSPCRSARRRRCRRYSFTNRRRDPQIPGVVRRRLVAVSRRGVTVGGRTAIRRCRDRSCSGSTPRTSRAH